MSSALRRPFSSSARIISRRRSGDSVAPALRFFKLDPTQLWVVHDELDLDLGRIQLKQGGGTGGHNGLKSIEASVGSREFGRLRISVVLGGSGKGVGRCSVKSGWPGRGEVRFDRPAEGAARPNAAQRAEGGAQLLGD